MNTTKFVARRSILAAGIGGLFSSTLVGRVFADEEWNRWGGLPFASSHGEACKKAPRAIDGFNLPSAVKEKFKTALGSACEGGTEVWLTPHSKLEQMWSGGAQAHVMDNVTVAELPVTKSPDGRAYRKGAVAETAKALSWSVEHEGKTYVLYLPYVCFNWSWAVGPSSMPLAALPPATGGGVTCPEYYTLKVYVWEFAAMRLPGVEQTYAKEALAASFGGKGEHVSRVHWNDFLVAHAKGTLKFSAIPHTFNLSLINTREARERVGSPAINAERSVGQVTVTGLAEVHLRREELNEWDAVRLVPVEPIDPSQGRGIHSPPFYPGSASHEMRLFNHLPPPNDGLGPDVARQFGEWKYNRVPDCLIGVHLVQTPE